MPIPQRRPALVGALLAMVMVVALPLSVVAHSELQSSVPDEGATVPSPFTGPVALTFTLHLATGSKADLVGPDGSIVATATVDPGGPTMTFNLDAPLAPGAYQVQWTSIADDGDLLRGIVKFSVAPAAATARSDASPTPEPSPASAPPATASSLPVPSPASSPVPSTSGGANASGAGSDVILPIIVALIVVAAGAIYLVRRNRPT